MVWDNLANSYFVKRLHSRNMHSPVVAGDVRGKGLMCALELVSDRPKKTAASRDVAQRVQDAAHEAGVIIRTSGANVIISPPLVITAADVDRILSALDAGLTAGAAG